jgi:anthranilate synthase component 1
MQKPITLNEFQELAKTTARVLIAEEIAADYLTPTSIFEALHTEMRGGALLESGVKDIGTGRYSFLCFDVMAQIVIKDGQVLEKVGKHTEQKNIDPIQGLRQFIQKYRCPQQNEIVGLAGGVVGYLAYDAVRIMEKIPEHKIKNAALPDVLFNAYRKNLAFDHDQQKVIIAINVEVTGNTEKDYADAMQEIADIIKKINNFSFTKISITSENKTYSAEPQSLVSDQVFMQQVEKAKQHVVSGDVFQVVLSRSFTMPFKVSPFSIYRGLRRTSPAPFMFYLDFPDFTVTGASPEKMACLESGKVSVNPIAGTRPRNKTVPDQQIIENLLSDTKETAEHMMLVDLARNDLGIICQPGTIKVDELMQARVYSHVIHLTSTVSGQINPAQDAFDVLKATFPAGTLSGAPKIRAMEIINEIEEAPRGLYGGAICCIDNSGNLNSCIAIRMAILKDNVAKIQTGAGIVYDSNPAAEAAETQHKARSIVEAIKFAEQHFM